MMLLFDPRALLAATLLIAVALPNPTQAGFRREEDDPCEQFSDPTTALEMMNKKASCEHFEAGRCVGCYGTNGMGEIYGHCHSHAGHDLVAPHERTMVPDRIRWTGYCNWWEGFMAKLGLGCVHEGQHLAVCDRRHELESPRTLPKSDLAISAEYYSDRECQQISYSASIFWGPRDTCNNFLSWRCVSETHVGSRHWADPGCKVPRHDDDDDEEDGHEEIQDVRTFGANGNCTEGEVFDDPYGREHVLFYRLRINDPCSKENSPTEDVLPTNAPTNAPTKTEILPTILAASFGGILFLVLIAYCLSRSRKKQNAHSLLTDLQAPSMS